MNIHEKLIYLVKMIYKNPTSMVKTKGNKSEWKQQKSGIRQGCPMSPYLFLIAMTTFADIKHEDTMKKKLEKNKPKGANVDEVLYADDTILASENTNYRKLPTQNSDRKRNI